MAMDERKRRILNAIIDDYILTALPVGSRTISRKYDMGLSSATIRNEMSDLEELGYLEQPHVSAGRIPNAKAYRLYVDHLQETGRVPSGSEEQIRQHFASRVRQLEDVVASTAQILSDLTGCASVVTMPRQEKPRISSLYLLPVTKATALLVIVTDAGIIRDSSVCISEHLDADALYAISRMLTERFANRTLGEVHEMLDDYVAHVSADPQVLMGISRLAVQMEYQSASDSLKVSGTHKILNFPEYADAEKARTVLSVLETKERLVELLSNKSDLSVTVHIGPETGIPEMCDCSVVMTSYGVGRGSQGTIGVIGPTRMPYARIMSTLSAVGEALSDMLSQEE